MEGIGITLTMLGCITVVLLILVVIDSRRPRI